MASTSFSRPVPGCPDRWESSSRTAAAARAETIAGKRGWDSRKWRSDTWDQSWAGMDWAVAAVVDVVATAAVVVVVVVGVVAEDGFEIAAAVGVVEGTARVPGDGLVATASYASAFAWRPNGVGVAAVGW